jgi:hypothetical protein
MKHFTISLYNGNVEEVALEKPGLTELPKGSFGQAPSGGAWCFVVREDDLKKITEAKKPRWVQTTDENWRWAERCGLEKVEDSIYIAA